MSNLCNATDDRFWPRLKWPDFADMVNKEEVVVVLPLVGFCDWRMDLPLDAEEVMAMEVLAAADSLIGSKVRYLVLPPLRFVLAPTKESIFGVSVEDAHRSLREIALSVKQSGFRKLVIYNSSPWNEDLADVAGRDLRIELGLQLFTVNLSGIGLDLLSGRSKTRLDCMLLACSLLGLKPGEILDQRDSVLNFNMAETDDAPVPLPENMDQVEVSVCGKVVLEKSATKLAALLTEVFERTPLPNAGIISDQSGGDK